MKGFIKYISRNWLWIAVGLVLTEFAVKAAYTQRGYLAYGGEWLTLPLMLILAEIVNNVGDAFRLLFGKEDEENEPHTGDR